MDKTPLMKLHDILSTQLILDGVITSEKEIELSGSGVATKGENEQLVSVDFRISINSTDIELKLFSNDQDDQIAIAIKPFDFLEITAPSLIRIYPSLQSLFSLK